MNLTLGFSPCPNDTFLFDALVHERIDLQGLRFAPTLDDVEALNEMAMDAKLDVTKLSYHAFTYLTDKYQMLSSGSALGEGVGPLLITRDPAPSKPMSEWHVALPGKYTTAHFLLKLAYPEIQRKTFLLFSEIENAVLDGSYDAGVIIHENRFTYADRGLLKKDDLGEKWEEEQLLPIPLGGIAIRRDLPQDVKRKVDLLVRRSTEYAFRYPQHSLPFVKANAQEMDPEVMRKHIELYVNPYTLDLGTKGKMAVERMLQLMSATGQTPEPTLPWMVQ